MEQRFSNNSLDLQTLREFCEREGEAVFYRKGEQLEREGDPARWFGFVAEGCFKYVTHGISDDREHITWFSFEGEFAGDYPACLNGGPALTTIEAMVPTRIIRVSGEPMAPAYSASKAYQINYMEALRKKAYKSGNRIHVTDIRPGLVDTAMAKGEGLFWVMPVEKVASQIIAAIRRKKTKAYVTKRWHILTIINKHLPFAIYKRI